MQRKAGAPYCSSNLCWINVNDVPSVSWISLALIRISFVLGACRASAIFGGIVDMRIVGLLVDTRPPIEWLMYVPTGGVVKHLT